MIFAIDNIANIIIQEVKFMELEKKFISYQDLADALGCSNQQIQKIHAKRIIEIFNIDVSRLPKSGVLPIDCCNQYFDVTTPIKKNTH